MRATIALGAGLLAAAALAASASPAPQRADKCRATLVYRAVTYYGIEGSHLRLRAGRSAGTGLEPECNDTPPPCRPGENCVPVKTRYVPVPVRRLAGVRARVAVARADASKVIYVAADRCQKRLAAAALVRCLKRSS